MDGSGARLGFLGALMALAGWGVARSVTEAEALAAAGAWSARNGHLVSKAAATSAVGSPEAVCGASGEVLFYLVPAANGEQTLAVAGETRLEPILAVFSGAGSAGGAAMVDILRADAAGRLAALESGTVEVARLAASAEAATPEEARWAELLGKPDAGAPALLAEEEGIADTPERQFAFIRAWQREQLTHWAQRTTNRYLTTVDVPVYNYYTPGKNYPCGCVATAAASVLEFLRVPAGPSGVTKKCTVDDESKDFTTKGGAYDWSILPTWVRGGTTLTEAQRELLGRVTYDVGVLLGMKWAPGASSAFTPALAEVFATYFNLPATRYATNIMAEEYGPLIYAPILCGRPVILSIQGSEGHAVVAVGYAETTQGVAYTRIFMGYGGSQDGWYALPKIATTYSVVKGAVTMIGGAEDPVIPVYGRVTSAAGAPAGFVEVSLLGHTVATSPFGTFAFLLRPSKVPMGQTLTLTVGGHNYPITTTNVWTGEAEDYCYIGLPEAVAGQVSAYALACALPPEQKISLPAGTATLTVRTLPLAAQNMAKREQKLILLLTGPSESADSIALQTALAQAAATLNERAIVCLCDETLAFAWWRSPEIRLGLFDPTLFSATSSWEENAPALIDVAATPERLAALVRNSHTLTVSGEAKPIPAAWLAKHFPAAATEALPALATEDSDGDGFTNAQEYILGTDPTDATSRFRFGPFRAQADGSLVPAYDTVSGRKYTLQGKAALGDAWGDPTAESRFFRVLISLP